MQYSPSLASYLDEGGGGGKKADISLPAIGITPLIIILIDPNRRTISGKQFQWSPGQFAEVCSNRGRTHTRLRFPITSPNHRPPPLPLPRPTLPALERVHYSLRRSFLMIFGE